MPATTPNSAFWTGFRDGLPFLLVLLPFGILFGVTATEAGLNLDEAMMFTIVVIAGASQFSALQLMSDHAPTLIVLATALAVNLRMAMYSASLTPYLGQATLWQRALISYFLVDATYACAIGRFEGNPGWTLPARLGYFAGTVVAVGRGVVARRHGIGVDRRSRVTDRCCARLSSRLAEQDRRRPPGGEP